MAKVAFTGETTTGRLIMQYASENLIPVTLELGGKSPNIFFADVHGRGRRLLRQGARGVRHVRPQPGRGLHLPSRALVQESIYDKFMERAVARVKTDRRGQSARSQDHDRRPGLQRSAGEDPELHRDREEGRGQGADRRGPPGPSGRAGARATTSSLRSSRGTTGCGSSRRRSSGRCVARHQVQGPWPTRCPSPTTRSTGWAPACGAGTSTPATGWAAAIKAGRVWTNCYHAYPAHAAFGGYKQSGIGRENHRMMLEHYQQTKNLLVSYSPKKLGFF